jgi:hypothetical protein
MLYRNLFKEGMSVDFAFSQYEFVSVLLHKLRSQLAADFLEECVARYWVLTYLLCVIVFSRHEKKIAVCLGLEFTFCTSLECFFFWMNKYVY